MCIRDSIYCSFQPSNIQYESVVASKPADSDTDKVEVLVEKKTFHTNGMENTRCVTPVEDDPELANAVAIMKSSHPTSVQPVLGAGLSFNLATVGNGVQRFREH